MISIRLVFMHEQAKLLPLEVFREWLFIKKDVGIVELLIEPIFHLFHAANYPIQVAISRCEILQQSKQARRRKLVCTQYDDCCIGPATRRRGVVFENMILARDGSFVRWFTRSRASPLANIIQGCGLPITFVGEAQYIV
jgi:hypothetical protein